MGLDSNERGFNRKGEEKGKERRSMGMKDAYEQSVEPCSMPTMPSI